MKLSIDIQQPPTVEVTATVPTVSVSTGTPVARERSAPAEYKENIVLTVNPTMSVDYNTGTITATNESTQNIQPVAAKGTSEPSDSVPVSVSGNAATQLYTLDAATYTPTKQTQTIEAGRFLVGDQTIAPIPPQYYDMSGEMAWMGKDAECIDNAVYSKTDNLKNTLFNGWTPSTTAKSIVATVTAKTFVPDLSEYEYYLVWDCGCNAAYTGTPTLKAHFLFSRCYLVQQITKRPSNFAKIQAADFDGNACTSLYTGNFVRYYGTTTGTVTYSWATSYGIYFAATNATFSNSTSDEPTITIKTPTVSARCSTTYFSTGNAALVDQENSEWFIRGKLYRVKRDATMRGIYSKVVALINE